MLDVEKLAWVRIDESSRFAYKLLSDVKRDIWDVFLHDESIRKMRNRQHSKTRERIEHNCKRISEIIKSARWAHILQAVISNVVHLNMVSQWSEPKKEMVADMVSRLHIDMSYANKDAKSEVALIWRLLQMLWMDQDALEKYLFFSSRHSRPTNDTWITTGE